MRLLRNLWMALVYLFLYVPIVILVVYSFNDSKFSTVWKGFTLRWYEKLAANAQLLDAALNSLLIAVSAATIATAIGTLAAVALYRYRFAGRQFLRGCVFILTVSPDIVMGISLLMLFVLSGVSRGFPTLLLAHITLCLPFVVITVLSRLNDFDENILEAARDLGAEEFEIFRDIIVPLALPGILAGWLLSFTLSLDDVMISFFVTGPGFEILPLRIYSMVKLGVKPEVNALCALLLVVTCTVVFLSQLLTRERKVK